MIGLFENGMASRTQSVCRKHSSLGAKKTMAEDRFRIQTSDRKRHRWTEWRIAVGTIDEVGVRCSDSLLNIIFGFSLPRYIKRRPGDPYDQKRVGKVRELIHSV